jgi:hypothetical protein
LQGGHLEKERKGEEDTKKRLFKSQFFKSNRPRIKKSGILSNHRGSTYHVAVKYKIDFLFISVNFSVASRSEIFVTDMYRKPTRLERPSSLFAAKPFLPKEVNNTAQRVDMMGTKMIRRLEDRNQ